MKEIKFRAWDLVNNKFREIESIVIARNNKPSAIVSKGEYYQIQSNSQIILLQYTGLKDKDGVEVYEGDIVKVDGMGLGIGFIEYHESYFRIFRPYSFSVNLCNHTESIELEPKNNVEVIGNIYQNKELLDEK